ncbi:MAG: insulinase family protein [Oscillospiraceae bacterium]|nr:insulinase family protein [Oscillospiraceae bacterium]
MEYSRVEIRPGVWLTHLREDKFKTACFSVHLLSQLNRETASMNALIPYVLRRGTGQYPDMETLSARMEELYGTVIEPSIRRIGEIHCCGFYASFPEDDFLPGEKRVLNDATALTLQMLLAPLTRGGLLLPAYVESEREKLLDLIASRVNNKRSYAVIRCIEEMCCCEDFSVSRYGDEESCRSINYKKLSRHYRTLLQTCPIELFYCGRASLAEMKAILRDQLATLPRGEIDDEIGTEIRMNALEEQPRYAEEEMDVAQANLVIGWRLGECMEDPDFAALYVFNDVFGGSPSSKLFLNVREKLSLCYYASSVIDVRKGLLLVSSGIQLSNCEAAKKEIFAQLDAVREGNFTDEELETAKAGVISDLRSTPDSQAALESFYLAQAVSGADYSPDDLAALVSEVTAERVTAIARTVECDQIYLLRQGADAEESTEEEDEDDDAEA